MNHGLCFAHPNESAYNIYRRLLIANPVFRSKIKNKVNKRQLIEAMKNETELFFNKYICENSNSFYCIDFHIIKEKLSCRMQCPECAKLIFHTDLFSLDWVKRCPVHQQKLTNKCPECNQYWPNSADLPGRTCSCCGSYPDNTSYKNRKGIQPLLIEKFARLKNSIKTFSSSSEYILYMRQDKYSRLSINAAHEIVSAFLLEAGEIDRGLLDTLGLESSLMKAKKVEFISEELDHESDVDTAFRQFSSDTFQIIRLAKMKKIVDFLNSLASCNHILHEACVFDIETACPHCYAFGLWYKLVFFNSISNFSNNLTMVPPNPCYYLADIKNRLLPENVQAILYDKDLEMSFFVIYQHVLQWLQLFKNFDSKNDIVNEPKIPSSNLFKDFWFKIKNNKISFYYSDVEILTEKNFKLPPEIQNQCHCEKAWYTSPTLLNMNNSVWLLNIDRRMLSDHLKPTANPNNGYIPSEDSIWQSGARVDRRKTQEGASYLTSATSHTG